MKKIIIIGLIITILLLSGCTAPKRETGRWVKEGSVVKIEYDNAFGGTFTDWRDEIYFEDGTILFSQRRDLSSIIINEKGKFYFDKNYFEYDNHWYKFDNFVKVEYIYTKGE